MIDPKANNAFIQQLTSIFGRKIEIVTGRNSYTIGKEKHAKMMEKDGMYILLNNPPERDMKQIFDKAYILPAKIVDGHFTCNDPARMKHSFHLPEDKIRLKFSAQCHKIYEFTNSALLIKVMSFVDSRRNLKVLKPDYDRLNKYGGSYLILCTTPDGRLIDVIGRSAHAISIPEGHVTKEIPIDLSQFGIDRLNQYTFTPSPNCKPSCFKNKLVAPNLSPNSICLTCPHKQECTAPYKEEIAAYAGAAMKQSTLFKDVDNYMAKGMHVILTFPEGKSAMMLECIIVAQKRVPMDQVKRS